MPAPTSIGLEFDFLAGRDWVIDYPPTKRICVVATVRNEGVGLLEWVAHYRVLGFDAIVVYSNDNTDHSEDLLSALANSDVIHLCWNVVAPSRPAQVKAYRHAFWCNSEVAQHEWVFPLDADEFLIPCIEGQPATNVRDWLSVIEQSHAPSAISLNWKWFSGDGSFEKADGLCMERFREAKGQEWVKTAFKIRDAVDITHSHGPVLRPTLKRIDGNGDPAGPRFKVTPVFRYGQINHYWNKSFEEFFIRKHRGYGSEPSAVQRAYADFFQWGRQRPDSPEPWPTPSFIGQVKDEMARLRDLPGVVDAERKTQARFREMLLENGGARAAYEATLRELRGQRPLEAAGE